jgi:hypothetical protein
MYIFMYCELQRTLNSVRSCFELSWIGYSHPSFSMVSNSGPRKYTCSLFVSCFSLFHILPWLSNATACFNPDGTEVLRDDYQPCKTGQHSMCCAINRLTPNVNVCRPDGLCIQNDTGTVYREFCSDPTWKDPACVPLCIKGYCMMLLRLKRYNTNIR